MALLVGNGHSSKYINLDDFIDFDIWSCNDACWERADYIVYYDKQMMDYFSEKKIPESKKLIGYKHKGTDHTIPRCDYYYDWNDIVFGDTGFHILQFADKLGYKKIYLCGYDYNCDIDSYHYKEAKSDLEKMVRFLKASISTVQKYYEFEFHDDILIIDINIDKPHTKSLLNRFPKVRIGDVVCQRQK